MIKKDKLIVVATHKEYRMPDDDMYLPVLSTRRNIKVMSLTERGRIFQQRIFLIVNLRHYIGHGKIQNSIALDLCTIAAISKVMVRATSFLKY